MPHITCQKCGKKFDTTSDNLYSGAQSLLCPHCGHKNAGGTAAPTPSTPSASAPPPMIVPPASAGAPPPPQSPKQRPEFETNRQGRFFAAYVATIKALLTNPKDYFKKYEMFRDLQSLFLFAYLNQLFATIPTALVQGLVFSLLSRFAGQMDDEGGRLFSQLMPGFSLIYGMLLILFGPLFSLLLSVVWSGLHHFFLKIIGTTQKDYATTLQVYLHFSFMSVICIPFVILGLIPILGGLFSLAMLGLIITYLIFYKIIGMAELHQIPTDRAAFSFIALVVACCCCCLAPWPILVGLANYNH